MKACGVNFHLIRPSVPLRDKPCPCTKTTFILFDYRGLKCFKSFTNFSVMLSGDGGGWIKIKSGRRANARPDEC